MAVSTSQIPAMLLPGVRKIKGDYAEIPMQCLQIFAEGTSDLQVERTVHARYLPLAGLKDQGRATNMDLAAGQRIVYSHIHVPIGLGYSFTREAIDDNLYKGQFDPTNLGLVKSFRATKETIGADVLNTGNQFNAAIGGDGFALFSATHPVDGYAIPNTPINQVGLNEATLLYGNNLIRRFRDYAGVLIGAQGKKLVLPVELRHVGKRLMETPLRTGTADNDVSAVREYNDLSDGYLVMDYLTSPYAWFIISDQGGLIYLVRKAFETSMQVDFATDNLLVKAYERYFMGYDDWRCAAGFFPSN